MTRILILQGHPDNSTPHLCHGLASAYADGARDGGHEVRSVDVAAIDFPLLRSQQAWEHESLPPALLPAQRDIAWAEHIVLFARETDAGLAQRQTEQRCNPTRLSQERIGFRSAV